MEILELIFGGWQLCDCFLGVMSLASATGGAVEARRGTANRRERRLAKQTGEKPPPVSRDNWIALTLFLLAVVLLLILGIGWIASRAQSGEAKTPAGPGSEGSGLLFSVRKWDGDYSSKDIPGGVAVSPNTSAIYTVNADGTGLKKLVQLGKNADNPTSSPDGKWIYFQSNATGRYHVYRCRPDGSGIVNLTAEKTPGKRWRESFGYFLSADGSKLLYTVHDGSTGHVALAEADGTHARLIAPELGYIYMAALSPRNDRVVFSGPARGYRLMTVTLPDGKPVELTPSHPESFVPQFTPDGKTVIFIRRDGDVYRVDTDGKNLRRLTNGNGYVEFRLSAKDQHGSTDGPNLSADGKRIAYIAVEDGVPNVCVMNVDGSGQRQVTFRKTPCGRVRWSRDGKELAFVSFDGKYPQLFVVPAAGGEPRQLTRIDGAVYLINWQERLAATRSARPGTAPRRSAVSLSANGERR